VYSDAQGCRTHTPAARLYGIYTYVYLVERESEQERVEDNDKEGDGERDRVRDGRTYQAKEFYIFSR
jgi:hypothetical protein